MLNLPMAAEGASFEERSKRRIMSVVGLIRRGMTVGSVLLPVVVTGCVASRNDYETVQTQNQQFQTQVQQLQTQNQQLTQLVAAQTGQITRLQGAIKYTVNSNLLFPSGSWKIGRRGQQIMAKMASELAPFQQNRLFVNGYADNAPIGPRLRAEGVTTNEELSQKRADAVMQYLISQGVKADMIIAKGWGVTNPVASNNTAAGRTQNRRVEITLAAPS
jgi:chemotaxis protein MotB